MDHDINGEEPLRKYSFPAKNLNNVHKLHFCNANYNQSLKKNT